MTTLTETDTPAWDDTLTGILAAIALAAFLSTCAWLLSSL
jgi:hypothetical protein